MFRGKIKKKEKPIYTTLAATIWNIRVSRSLFGKRKNKWKIQQLYAYSHCMLQIDES